MKATVFLGGGRITSALAAGLRLAGYEGPVVVYDHHVYDHNPEKLRALWRESRVEIARDLKSAVAQAEMLIVAVRPASVAGLLNEIAECGAQPGLCVSLAAGIPLKVLRSHLLRPARWVRAMPSPVCRIGRGLTALCFDRGIAKTERLRVRELFQCVGQVVEVREAQLDAFTATFSPTHGYHALATLSAAARGAGLDRNVALAAAAHALADGITYWRKSGEDLNDLLHEAATPGGIAATTIAAMENAGYARAVTRGLKAGMARAKKNSKE